MSQDPKASQPPEKPADTTSKWQPLIDGLKTIGIPALLTILGLVFAVAWALPKGVELSITKLSESHESLGQLQQRISDATTNFDADKKKMDGELQSARQQIVTLQREATTTAEFLRLVNQSGVNQEQVRAVLAAISEKTTSVQRLAAEDKMKDDIRLLAAAVDRVYSDALFRQGDAPAWHSLLLQHYGFYKDRLTQMQSTPPATQPAR